QLSTDGFRPYRTAIPEAFGLTVDFAQLVKVYATPREEGPQTRYSRGDVVDTYTVVLLGWPEEERICTSHAERANLTIRMTLGRRGQDCPPGVKPMQFTLQGVEVECVKQLAKLLQDGHATFAGDLNRIGLTPENYVSVLSTMEAAGIIANASHSNARQFRTF